MFVRAYERRVFSAPPHAMTWSIMVFTAFSWVGAGLKER